MAGAFPRCFALGKYKLLALEHPGRVVVYQVERGARTELKAAALETKPSPGLWIDLSYMAEGGDLLVTVNQQPVFLLPLSLPTDRAIYLVSDTEANVREINLRR